MICKTFVSVAIVSLVAVGVHLHLSPLKKSEAIQIGYRSTDQHESETSFQSPIEEESDEPSSMMSSIHDHLFEVHNRFLNHAHDWLSSLHRSDKADLHFDHLHDDHTHGEHENEGEHQHYDAIHETHSHDQSVDHDKHDQK
jgi:hypothetical protein